MSPIGQTGAGKKPSPPLTESSGPRKETYTCQPPLPPHSGGACRGWRTPSMEVQETLFCRSLGRWEPHTNSGDNGKVHLPCISLNQAGECIRVSTTQREQAVSAHPCLPIAVAFAGLVAISFMSYKYTIWERKAVINACLLS